MSAHSLNEALGRVTSQRDELLTALVDLNALIAAWRVTGKPELALIAAAQERADTAIAKAGGK